MWVSKKWNTIIRSVVTAVIILLAIIGFATSPDTLKSASTEEVKSDEKAEPVAGVDKKEDKAAEKQKKAEAKAAEEEAAKEKEEAEKKAKEEEQAAKEKAEKEKAEKAEAKKKAEPSLEETIFLCDDVAEDGGGCRVCGEGYHVINIATSQGKVRYCRNRVAGLRIDIYITQ
ncbi:hypothetical protein SAMN05421663_11362 [Terribacillus halophilus]|uniref:Uncharacterized protein n=1 Tax=Terribacillus halophilus TaxID=361279 RepID=A0A1G6VQG6_9BACI|nr:hypothetical protein [Terribacillus halophilus]SDD55105.1 hypothetical protein SAMN05421663_11362 [Terribacillus halophilus]